MKQFQIAPLLLMITSSMLVFISSCKKEDLRNLNSPEQFPSSSAHRPDDPGFASNEMVMYWNNKAEVIINGPFNPPSQSRFFAMVQIAIHDALNSIKPKFETYALKNERSQFANPDAAVASAAYWTLKNLNVHGAHPLDDWYNSAINNIPTSQNKDDGIVLGKKAAEAIIAKRASDNYAAANIIQPVPDGVNPGDYRSTLPFSLPNMPRIKGLHQWGTNMTPFVVQSNHQFRPPAPYPINSPEYTIDYNEVKSKGAKENHNRTADEEEIGRFWVERSTIGWNRFARNVIISKKMDAWKAARLFALLHTAMADLATGSFEAKYHYFYWRPETAVRMGDVDGNSNTTGDADWLPGYLETPNPNPAMNIYTPPVPEYPSLHAGFGGAAAEIIKMVIGSDQVSVAQTSPTTPGVTRYYNSLSQAARDNSLSRIYVGFHFRKAIDEGEVQGKQIGLYVYNNSFREVE